MVKPKPKPKRVAVPETRVEEELGAPSLHAAMEAPSLHAQKENPISGDIPDWIIYYLLPLLSFLLCMIGLFCCCLYCFVQTNKAETAQPRQIPSRGGMRGPSMREEQNSPSSVRVSQKRGRNPTNYDVEAGPNPDDQIDRDIESEIQNIQNNSRTPAKIIRETITFEDK